ncbi:MAG: segregation/condensation protein A [Opitutaceae bacterium]
MVAETDHPIKLEVFEGPLDLLLFLIRKSEVDIYDIPIADVLKQYLDVLFAMKELQLEVAGDFFVMAASLMEIKSRMLLPKQDQAVDPDAEEDDSDPRWELVHQLLEYRKFRDAASSLDALSSAEQNRIARDGFGQFDPVEDRPLAPIDRLDVWNNFNLVLRRLAEKLVVGEITDDRTTVVDQMEMILERAGREKTFTFSSLLPEHTTLRTLVVTFLAILELVRMRRLTVTQNAAFTDIHCHSLNLENELDPSEA